MKLQQLRTSHLQWMLTANNSYQVCGQTRDILPAGAYNCEADGCGNPLFVARNLEVDELIDFPGSLPASILEEIDRFWSMGDRFARLGFLHRRGFLLYGKQGSGKSSLIHQIISRILDAGHVAFFCAYPGHFVQCVQKFRQVEPNRPMVCVFEDIDAIINNWGDSDLLQWLDGNYQVDKAINIASTNYPENLDPRIVARPRRFDRILRIDSPEAGLREAYFARKLPELSNSELARWVELTEGLSFAALAEVVISVFCLDKDLEETVTLLKTIDAASASSEEFFSFKNDSDDFDDEAEIPSGNGHTAAL